MPLDALLFRLAHLRVNTTAVELRDEDAARYLGKGVQKAVENVNTVIAAALAGADVFAQNDIDTRYA